MKDMGLITDTEYPDWFTKLFRNRRGIVPHNPYKFMQAEDTVRLINDAGGIAIVAHPANQLKHIEPLMKIGVVGLECWHADLRRVSQELDAIKIAKKYNLFVSGGEDHSGLCGGQYERFDEPEKCPYYFPEQTLGAPEFFFRELKNGSKAFDRADMLDHYVNLQSQITPERK